MKTASGYKNNGRIHRPTEDEALAHVVASGNLNRCSNYEILVMGLEAAGVSRKESAAVIGVSQQALSYTVLRAGKRFDR